MKKYFNVSFRKAESVYCANIAHAETVADVEEARRRGKPIVEIETRSPYSKEEEQ